MADYPTARAAIASIIDAVAITDPVTTSIAKVYESRPDSGALSEFPCVIITGFSMRYQRGMGKRERTYSVGLRIVVTPIPDAPMHETLDALKNAVSEAFDLKTKLGIAGGYHVVEGPNWLAQEPLDDGGTLWDEGEIILSLKDTAEFSA